jgi:hypothetical protein
MPFSTKRQPLRLTADEKQRLEMLRRSRSAETREMLHAAILLDLADGRSANSVAISNGVNRHTVVLCANKYFQFGLETALGDLPSHVFLQQARRSTVRRNNPAPSAFGRRSAKPRRWHRLESAGVCPAVACGS